MLDVEAPLLSLSHFLGFLVIHSLYVSFDGGSARLKAATYTNRE
jgi:hypothetical protein